MQINVKDIVEKIYRSPWGKAGFCALYCIVLYLFCKYVVISENALSVINIGIVFFLLIAFYVIVKERKVPIIRIFLILSFGFIINEFYIPDKFYHHFHVKLEDACRYGIIIGIIYILIPHIIRLLRKILIFIEEIVLYCIEKNKIRQQKEEAVKEEVKKKSKHRGKEIVSVLLEKVGTSKEETINLEGEAVEKEENMVNQVIYQKEKQNIYGDKVAFFIILIIILIVPILIILNYLNRDIFSMMKSIEFMDFINMIIPFITVVICLIIVCAMAIGVILKLVHTLVDILFNRNKKSYYFIYVGVFLLISAYVSKRYNYTIDDVADSITSGDIFSFPLIMVIILPVFITLMDSLWKYFEKSKEIKEEIIELVHTLAFEIIISLLKYVRFVTADFLSSIAEIVEGDLHNDAEEQQQDKGNVNSNEEQNKGNVNRTEEENKGEDSNKSEN